MTIHTSEFEYVCDLHIHTDDHIIVEYEFTVNCETSDRLSRRLFERDVETEGRVSLQKYLSKLDQVFLKDY